MTKVAETDLSTIRWKQLMRVTPNLVWLTDATGKIIELNPAWQTYTGQTNTTDLSQSFFEAIHPDEQDVAQRLWQQAVQAQTLYETTIRLRNERGSYAPFLLQAQPLENENQVVEWMGIAIQQQVTEEESHQLNIDFEQRVAQRTAQLEVVNHQNEELRQRERQADVAAQAAVTEVRTSTERLTLALDAAKMGWWDVDVTTDRAIWNSYHEIIFGYEPGTPERDYFDWERRVHPEDLEQIHVATYQARDNRENLAIQYRIIWPDGSVHWIDAFGRFSYDPEGRPVRMLGVVTDITERKKTELALRESEEKVRLATVASELGMWFWHLETNNLVWTDKCKALFGLPLNTEMSYELFIDCLHPDDRQRTHGAVTRALDEKVEYDIEYRTIWSNGTIHWIAAKGRGFYDSEGRAVKMIGTAQDISERKQAESILQQRSQELESMNTSLFKASTMLAERNQELDHFVHVVSHDLKAPLRGIANLAEWIEDDLAGQLPEENRSQLQLMRQRVDRMDRLINGLLEYSRLGRGNVITELVNVQELLAEILDSLTVPSNFTVETECQVSTLLARRILLSQVLMNLISNALKYHNRPDGLLRIGVHDLGKHYEFWVQDDGPGIPSEHHACIFEIFQTLKPSSCNESTGIGLSIVKKIVEVEGGTIQLESKVGVGSIFRFTWPKQTSPDRLIL